MVNAIWGFNSMPRSISAGALDQQLRPQPYSSQGPGQCSPIHPTVGVPTHGILPWGGGFLDFQHQGGGTSSAAALLAGAVALIYSVIPEIGSQQLIQVLRETATPIFRQHEPQFGAGLLQVQQAIRRLLEGPVIS